LGHPADAALAVKSIARVENVSYIQVCVKHPAVAKSLRLAGFTGEQPDWGVLMIKPLTPDITADDARRLFGIGAERFLISWLDTT